MVGWWEMWEAETTEMSSLEKFHTRFIRDVLRVSLVS